MLSCVVLYSDLFSTPGVVVYVCFIAFTPNSVHTNSLSFRCSTFPPSSVAFLTFIFMAQQRRLTVHFCVLSVLLLRQCVQWRHISIVFDVTPGCLLWRHAPFLWRHVSVSRLIMDVTWCQCVYDVTWVVSVVVYASSLLQIELGRALRARVFTHFRCSRRASSSRPPTQRKHLSLARSHIHHCDVIK